MKFIELEWVISSRIKLIQYSNEITANSQYDDKNEKLTRMKKGLQEVDVRQRKGCLFNYRTASNDLGRVCSLFEISVQKI